MANKKIFKILTFFIFLIGKFEFFNLQKLKFVFDCVSYDRNNFVGKVFPIFEKIAPLVRLYIFKIDVNLWNRHKLSVTNYNNVKLFFTN